MVNFNKKISLNDRIKKAFSISVKSDCLKLKMQMIEGVKVSSIILRNEIIGIEKYFQVEKKAENTYVIELNQIALLKELTEIDNNDIEKESSWSWYADLCVEDNIEDTFLKKELYPFIKKNIGNEEKYWQKENKFFLRKMRIGKFINTESNEPYMSNYGTHSIITYINKYGYLVTILNGEVNPPYKIQLEKLKTHKSRLSVTGVLNYGYFPVKDSNLLLKSRNTENEIFLKLVLNKREAVFSNKFGKYIYDFHTEVDFNNLLPLQEDVYDVFIEIKTQSSNANKRIRVGRPTLRAKYFFHELMGTVEDSYECINLINPYYTVSQSNLSLEVYPYLKDNYYYLKKITKFSLLRQLFYRKKDIWIVGERPYKAQDTGLSFFKYVRTNHPNRNIYYIIDKNSPEYNNVEEYGNVLDFGSKEHIKMTLLARKVFSSHHADYLFPLRNKSFKKKVKAVRIFIQHGVLGVKKLNHMYSVRSKTFKTDMFITSSEYEKEYIVRDMGYRKEDVFVTGLSRFDTLFKNDTKLKRQVLLIPTWREWLQNIDSFLESEYFKRYSSLIKNSKLLAHAKNNNYKIILCLHPNMQNFSSFFDNESIDIIYQGERDVQELIKESMLMITDYSSVAFDFSFLHKPVVYYQFDREAFIGRKGSHINIDDDLPGDILYDEGPLVNTVIDYANNDFQMKEEYKQKANKFIKYRDTNSSQRIYNAAINYKKKNRLFDYIQNNNFLRELFGKFRRSKWYFPTMKKMYSVMKTLLPIEKDKIVIESGIGKNFSDSPKEIFDILRNQNKNYKFVWIYNKAVPRNYKNTNFIKRLSPQYYYHLATANYWINNQNFPTYIKKRKKTVYLQTWHGTPLKHMLHDIEKIHGRDETYLDRVTRAVKNWDYLISPSRYASNCFRSAFHYEGEIIETGYPRNDIFYRNHAEQNIQEMKEKLNVPKNKKVILYAPTFRDDQKKGKHFQMSIPMDFDAFNNEFGEDYVLLVRFHTIVSSKLKIEESWKNTIINVSNYPDIQELMLISDILITDYSSVFFDYLNTDRPILFYTYDYDKYKNKLRGFYLDFENEAPGPLCIEQEELFDAIRNIESESIAYRNKYNGAKEKFCYLDDGNAATRVVNKVFKY